MKVHTKLEELAMEVPIPGLGIKGSAQDKQVGSSDAASSPPYSKAKAPGPHNKRLLFFLVVDMTRPL